MTLKEFDDKYGRSVLIAGCLIIWAVILWSIWSNGYLETWGVWRFPAKLPPFMDFRLIPGSAETFRSGIDPAISNPFDPRGRIFNYPKIWYLLFYTGISQSDTVWICVVLLVLFFLIVFAFPDRIRVRDSILLLAVVFSSSSALLYERGNVDLIIFIFCGLTILLLDKFPGWATGVLSFAVLVKFFPFFAVPIFFKENKSGFYRFFGVSLLFLLAYVIIDFDSLTASWTLTQRGTYLSYGVYVVFDLLAAYIRYYLLRVIAEGQIHFVVSAAPHISALVLLIVTFFLAVRKNNIIEFTPDRNLTAFRLGASIFVGTFLLGNNWDYRLAFLIFTIPQISMWMFSPEKNLRRLAIGVFLPLFVSCWYTVIRTYFLLATDGGYELQYNVFDEIMNWTLFTGFAYLLIATAPAWFRSFGWNPFTPESAA